MLEIPSNFARNVGLFEYVERFRNSKFTVSRTTNFVLTPIERRDAICDGFKVVDSCRDFCKVPLWRMNNSDF